jgi:hypothetical protein
VPEGIDDGFTGNTKRFVSSPHKQMFHGDVETLDGSTGYLCSGRLVTEICCHRDWIFSILTKITPKEQKNIQHCLKNQNKNP